MRLRRPPRAPARAAAGRAAPSGRVGVNRLKRRDSRREAARARRARLLRGAGRILKVALVAALALGAAGAGVWALARRLDARGSLALKRIDVEGNRNLSREAILSGLSLELGARLWQLSPSDLRDRLARDPWIKRASVTRIFPGTLRIRVEERAPVAMGRRRGWWGIAADGSALPRLDPARNDLPVLDGFDAMGAAELARVAAFLDSARAAYPVLYADFSQLRARAPDDLEVFLRDGRLRVRLDPGVNPLNSLEFLQDLLRQQGRALGDGRSLDLRVEGFAYAR